MYGYVCGGGGEGGCELDLAVRGEGLVMGCMTTVVHLSRFIDQARDS
jgi:hypothetical protein